MLLEVWPAPLYAAGSKQKHLKIPLNSLYILLQTEQLQSKKTSLVYNKKPTAPPNINSIGIEVVGMPVDKNGKPTLINKNIVDWEPLTAEQTRAVVSIVRILKIEYDITNDRIKTHEGVQPKTKGEGETVKQAIKEDLKL